MLRRMLPETVIEISQETEAHHARKQRNVKNSQKDGVLLVKRDGYTACIEVRPVGRKEASASGQTAR